MKQFGNTYDIKYFIIAYSYKPKSILGYKTEFYS